ncbi:MAG: PIN domain-containing protein [Actinobacteria bacterium]|nr:PIN domain-containing protein [Actinomycetota bacterium]
MAPVILLDTHVVLWVYTGDYSRLSAGAAQALETHDLAVSPVVELELAFLHEVGRVTDQPAMILSALSSSIGVTVAQIGFAPLCATAVGLTWTRDPFDRLLAAHSMTAGLQLLTKDRSLLENLDLAFWD